MESILLGRNLGKCDISSLADEVDKVIEGGQKIFRNSLNQVRIFFEALEDTSLLITLGDLKLAEYKVFIQIGRKGFL